MHHLFRAILAAMTCLAASLLAAQTATHATSLPRLPPEVAADFTGVGRLGPAGFVGSQGCSATLIAPNLILTAAHCASVTGTSDRVFVPGWTRSGQHVAYRLLDEIRHPDYAPDGRHSPPNDIALIVLETGVSGVVPISLAPKGTDIGKATRTAVIGYHWGVPNEPSGRLDCPVTYLPRKLLHVGCPVHAGNSGAPVLAQDDAGGWQVVGVISSRNGSNAIAVELPDWLRALVAAHNGT